MKSIEEKVEEINKVCNSSLCIYYWKSEDLWKIESYELGSIFFTPGVVIGKTFKEVVEKAYKIIKSKEKS